MSNDYEYLGDSQIPPPMAPRPPSNAHPDLITGLSHTPALKANDDVDLESNRPRGNNNLSFSDNLNPRRSEPSVAGTKTSRSAESDEESKTDVQKHSDSEQEKKNQKCGTCWYIFAGVTIFLAVISLLGLGAFLLLNSSVEPINAALNQSNETSTPEFKSTTLNISFSTTQMSGFLDLSSTTSPKTTKKSMPGNPENGTTYFNITSMVSPTSSLPLEVTESSHPVTPTPTSSITIETRPTAPAFFAENQTSTTETAEQTEKIEEALPIEVTTSALTVETTTYNITSPVEKTTPIELETTTELMTSDNNDQGSTTKGKLATEKVASPEPKINLTIAEN